MMVIEVCDTSISYKMDNAAISITALRLEDFPGENM